MIILIDGWLNYPHSYSIININQILALRKIVNQENIYLKIAPKMWEEWEELNLDIILTNDEIKIINSIKRYDEKVHYNIKFDIIYRLTLPIDTNGLSDRIIINYKAEYSNIKSTLCESPCESPHDFINKCKNRDILLVTPSNWSSNAMKREKYEPLVIPYGVNIEKFFPIDDSDIRETLKIPNEAFVFLNIHINLENKNISGIIKEFYKITFIKDNVYLVLKGVNPECFNKITDDIKEMIKNDEINKKRWKKIRHQIRFIDQVYSYTEMNDLYNMCDCYISPYIADGFNLCVLEAIACGKVVIVPKGGSSDDYTDEFVAKYPKTVTIKNEFGDYMLIVDKISLQEEMIKTINDNEYRINAKEYGVEKVKREYTWEKITDKLYGLFEFVNHERKSIQDGKKINYNVKRI